MATLTTLVTFDGTNGDGPGHLLFDTAGDLLGTTGYGGANGGGTVFEVVDSGGLYASTPTTLANFIGGANSAYPSSLSIDDTGDLIGTTTGAGGQGNDGTIFEVAKSGGVYASTPTTLASFTSGDILDGGALPSGPLVIDSAGDIFGTTGYGGPGTGNGYYGTVFELANTASGYASTVTVVASFDGADGEHPYGLITDAAGDLLGTTEGSAGTQGTAYELTKTAGGYSNEPTTLVTFDITDGEFPAGILVADADGDLFGTTSSGGAEGNGTLFEIPLVDGIYATTPVTLANFAANDLILDAAGNLFGTIGNTVFELAKTANGYASKPTTVYSFAAGISADTLIADAAGDLFGTTGNVGASGDGTVFELTGTGFDLSPLVLFGGGANFSYSFGGASAAIGAALALTDTAVAPLAGATVAITAGFAVGDLLNFTNQNGIAGSYNATTGVLTLTGNASAADYQAALQSITYSSTNGNLTLSGTDQTRTVTFTVTDGTQVSNAATTTVDVMAPAILGYLSLNDFIVGAGGQVSDEEFNSQGVLQITVPLLLAGTIPFTVTPGESIVGSAFNFLGNDLRNLLVRHPTGQLVEEGFSGGGLDLWTQPLSNGPNAPFTIDATATIAGAVLNFDDDGLDNLFVREANGQVTAQGFSAAGLDTWTQALSGFTLTPAESIAGSSPGFLGNHLSNLFVVNGNGQVVDEGFSGGADTWTQRLWLSANAPFTLDPIETIAGTGRNFLGNGLDNLFVVSDSGQVVDQGFTTAGLDTWTQPLTVAGGGAFTLDPASSVVGVGENFLTAGGFDLFLRGATGQISVSEFNEGGLQTGSASLPALGNGDSLQVQVGTPGSDNLTAPSGASTLIGDGGNDTYGFGPTVGHEVIVNGSASSAAPAGTLNITAANSDTLLWLDRVDDTGAVSATGNNLRIDVLSTSRSVTIDDWFAPGDTGAQLAELVLPGAAGGALKLDSGVNALVQAMANFEASYAMSHGGSAFDPTNPANAPITDASVLAAVSGAWHT